MSQPSERTRLLTHKIQPQYVFQSSINRERKRRVKHFQCCTCAIFLLLLLVALIATVAYSINHAQPEENTNDTTNSTEPLPFSSVMVLMSRSWPIPDVPNKNATVEDEKWDIAIEDGKKKLWEKDEIEKDIPSLKLQSPSYKHQKVIATTEKGRNMSKIGFVEEYATRFYNKDRTNVTVTEKLCHKTHYSSPEYCENKVSTCNHFQKYRSFNGTCNNLKYPDFYGVAYRPFRRSLSPQYADGVSRPRISKDGTFLPSARTVSLVVHRPISKNDPKFTVMLAVWGQFLDHDITATALSQKSNGSTISCCNNSGITSPECFPVMLDLEDPFTEFNVSCIEFVRSAPALTCCLGPRQQLNQATAFIDGSVMYGNDEQTARNLRNFENGTMKVFMTQDGRILLPISEDLNDGCNREEERVNGRYCFMTGDPRANENLHLTSMHLLWVRHHNSIAKNLSILNPHWSDEQVFQETRRIIAAQMQYITYQEFLPILLGDQLMSSSNLYPEKKGYSTKYNDTINPDIANNFATAAFRFAHSIIPGLMKLLAYHNSSPEYIQMHKMLFNPYELYQPGEMDKALRGAMNTSIEASDSYFTEELKSRMFETPEQIKQPKLCGLDLVSLNIQRGRDHGLPGYPYWREHCGFKRPTNFSDLQNYLDPNSLENIKIIYRNVDDIDLYTGALSETPLEGSILGPTITCLILDQFYRIKHGDRFWYESNQYPQAFTSEQLDELRKTSLAYVVCNNADNLEVIQPKVMERIGVDNDYVSCNDIPQPNLEFWRESLRHLNLTKDESDINILDIKKI